MVAYERNTFGFAEHYLSETITVISRNSCPVFPDAGSFRNRSNFHSFIIIIQ